MKQAKYAIFGGAIVALCALQSVEAASLELPGNGPSGQQTAGAPQLQRPIRSISSEIRDAADNRTAPAAPNRIVSAENRTDTGTPAYQASANTQANVGSAQNVSAARSYYDAASRGEADAQANLGAVYAKGVGVQRSDTESFRWFKRAADQGHAEAQLMLGVLYATGKGISANDVSAYKWASLAAANAIDPDTRNKAKQLALLVTRRMTPDQLAEAQKRVAAWQPEPEVTQAVQPASIARPLQPLVQPVSVAAPAAAPSTLQQAAAPSSGDEQTQGRYLQGGAVGRPTQPDDNDWRERRERHDSDRQGYSRHRPSHVRDVGEAIEVLSSRARSHGIYIPRQWRRAVARWF